MSNTTIHSTTTMEFPKAKQEALQKQAEARNATTAHFPNKNQPREQRRGQQQRPMMQPVMDENVGVPAMPVPIVGRPVGNAAAAPAEQTPMTAMQHNMSNQSMGHAEVAQPPQRPSLGIRPEDINAHDLRPSFNPPPVAHQQYVAPATHTPANIPVVENEMPGFTRAVSDSEGTSLALPSRFAFYDFKDVYAVPFRAKHLAKLQRAHREGSLLPLVEAVSSVIYTTTEGHPALAFDLTLPDFFFVLYWLRLNAFTKSNYTHTTTCDNAEHLKRVEIHEKLALYQQQVHDGVITMDAYRELEAQAMPESSLQIKELIRASSVKVNELEAVPDPAHFHFSDTSAMVFRAPTMRDVIEFAEAPEMQKKETRTEYSFLGQLASHIQHSTLSLTLAQRVGIVEEATSDQVQLLKDFEKAIKGYGVDETVKVTCKGCGASKTSKLVLDAFSFLPTN